MGCCGLSTGVAAGDRNIAWQGEPRRPVGYIHSRRRVLLSYIEAKGVELSPAGRAVIKRQDAKICRWRRATPIEAAA